MVYGYHIQVLNLQVSELAVCSLLNILTFTYLDSLPVLTENVYADDGFVELWISRLHQFIVQMLLKNEKS
jgi:hypothetical protein